MKVPAPASVSPAEAHLFIVNPMNALNARGRGGVSSLFRTHPPTEARVERLRAIASELRGERGPIG
jgi:heat shock protein HtpX